MRIRILSSILFFVFIATLQGLSQDKLKIKLDSLLTSKDSVAIDTANVGDTKEFAQIKQKEDKLFWDAHVRLRHEFWNNQEDLNDDLDDLYSFLELNSMSAEAFAPQKTLIFMAAL